MALDAVLVFLEGDLHAAVGVIAAYGEWRAQDGIFGGGSVVVSTLPFTGGDIGGSGVCGAHVAISSILRCWGFWVLCFWRLEVEFVWKQVHQPFAFGNLFR